MCLFNDAPKPAPTPPAPAKAPATMDFADMGQTPSSARKLRSKGKRSVRNKKPTGTTGLSVGGTGSPSLNIPSNKGGG
tara:strand:+ start:375 stop:608 length:234 start_codon:yes stop_codon:yes gene_type:complete